MSVKRKPDPTGGDLDLSSVGPGLEHNLRDFTAMGVLQKVPCVLDWMEVRGITVVITVEGDT